MLFGPYYSNNLIIFLTTLAQVYGWGTTSSAGPLSSKLLEVSVPVVTQTQTNGQKMVSAVSAPTELDLNTPLVQDDTQDPLRAMMFRRK